MINPMTDLTIIVVSYRGRASLTRCLDSLRSLASTVFRYEVIVVDNNSGDDTIPGVEKEFPEFRFIHNKINGGYANGNNLGARNANGEFLLILNPDTVVTGSSVSRLLETARSNPDFSVISCRQVNETGKEVKAAGQFLKIRNITGFQRSILQLMNGKTDKNHPGASISFPDWVSGSVILIRRELFWKLGGFFEGYWMYFEDMDLCKKVFDTGGKIAFLNDVTIEHNHGGSSRINLNTTSITKTEVQISRHIYVSRNMKGAGKTMIQMFLVINNLISGAVMAIAGIILFFIPKVFVQTVIYFRLIGHYAGSLFRGSWIGRRAMRSLNAVN